MQPSLRLTTQGPRPTGACAAPGVHPALRLQTRTLIPGDRWLRRARKSRRPVEGTLELLDVPRALGTSSAPTGSRVPQDHRQHPRSAGLQRERKAWATEGLQLRKVVEPHWASAPLSACDFTAPCGGARRAWTRTYSRRRRQRPPPTTVTGAGRGWGEELPLNYLNFVQRGDILTEERI